MKKIVIFFALINYSSFIAQISINANIPSTISIGNSTDVEVKINKGTVSSFAKYQMDVPLGIVVSSVDSKSGNFTFENQRAKIVWVSVPSDPEFSIKFKVSASSEAPNQASFSQKFYYLENNEKKEVEANPITVTISGAVASDETDSASNNNKPAEPTEKSKTYVDQNITVTTTEYKNDDKPATETNGNSAATVSTTTESVKTYTNAETKTIVTKKTTTYESKEVESSANKVSAPSTSESALGMTFKIQIGAYSLKPNKSKFPNAGNVNVDLINGMYKITTGTFKTLDDAVKRRDELKAKGYNGFIVRYKDGVRIN
jgi:cell division septation protein DedD